ncbi:MAG: hypothetical protein RL071_4836 [Pseudomonadota bacterium]
MHLGLDPATTLPHAGAALSTAVALGLRALPLGAGLFGGGRFDGQVALVTGAGSGIGEACALELARRGADLALLGRRADRLEAVAAAVRATGRRALSLPCDVTDHAALGAAVQAAVDGLGGLDLALANAGAGVNGRLEVTPVEQWRRQFELNVLGVVSTAQHCLPHLRARQGRLGLVGSVMGFLSLAGSGPYASSKAAVRSIGATLRLELAGSGVSCTTIHPGFVESEIAKVDNDGQLHPDRVDRRPSKVMWTADRAARVMVDALYDRKGDFVFTGHGKAAAFVAQHAPDLVELVLRVAGDRATNRPRP